MPDLKVWCDKEFERLKSETDRLFDNFYNEFGLSRLPAGRVDINMHNEPERMVFRIRVLGYDDMDISLDITDTHLVVSGRREHNMVGGSRVDGFSREIALPAGLAVEEAQAVMHGDTMEIVVPKRKSRAKAKLVVNVIKKRGE